MTVHGSMVRINVTLNVTLTDCGLSTRENVDPNDDAISPE